MNGFEKRRAKKTEKIIRAAAALFRQFGLQKTSINEIAAKAGVSPATIFNYFGNKEQLAQEVLAGMFDRQLERYRELLDSALPFPEKTRELMAGETEILREMVRFRGAGVPDAIVEFLNRYSMDKLYPLFMEYVGLGKAGGYISPRYSVETIFAYMDMYMQQIIRMMGNDSEFTEQSVEEFMDLFFYGLIGNQTRPGGR